MTALRSKRLEIAERRAARERKRGNEEEAGRAARQDHGLLSPEWRTHRCPPACSMDQLPAAGAIMVRAAALGASLSAGSLTVHTSE
jgi:hypothetical protein